MDTILSLQLNFTENNPVIQLREITGRDEIYLNKISSSSAIGLINRMLVPDSTTEGLTADKIATADRDQVLANLYGSIFGDTIAAYFNCPECFEKFEMDFQLSDLQAHIRRHTLSNKNRENQYQMGDCSFRLPTGEDEIAIEGLNKEEARVKLLQRCIVEGKIEDARIVEQAMSKVAPLIQTELTAYCPECKVSQQVRFDIQTYLLTKLIHEQNALITDIHRLAMAYKWSHQEILDLPRSLRRKYVRLVETELGMS